MKEITTVDDIGRLRTEIDTIDLEILRLFERRMETVAEISRIKKQLGLPVYHPKREEEILQGVMEKTAHPEWKNEIRFLFKQLLHLSRSLQVRGTTLPEEIASAVRFTPSSGSAASAPIIAYQGEPGAFGEQALNEFLEQQRESGIEYRVEYRREFKDLFEALAKDEIQYAVLPIENSYAGGVYDVYDMLNDYPVYVVGEIYLSIQHHLLGLPDAGLDGIAEVYSHPQALQQCEDFLNQHPGWRKVPFYNTAGSAKRIAELGDPSKAAIASREAAKRYGLKVLQENIHSNRSNWTRFFILGRTMEVKPTAKKISLIYSVPHHAGALFESLAVFSLQGINMVKIESRPTKRKPWQYYFFVDIEGNLMEQHIIDALNHLKGMTPYFKILGNY